MAEKTTAMFFDTKAIRTHLGLYFQPVESAFNIRNKICVTKMNLQTDECQDGCFVNKWQTTFRINKSILKLWGVINRS